MLSIFFILFTFTTQKGKIEKEKEKKILFNEHSSSIQNCLQPFFTHFFIICLDNFLLHEIAKLFFSRSRAVLQKTSNLSW